MSEPFAYDVFLSYSQADAKWVRGELLTRLERADLKVCIDHRDFESGAPKPTKTERTNGEQSCGKLLSTTSSP